MTDRGFVTPIALDRDAFMRRLIASLGYLNEGILGSDVTGAYIMNVGLSMGAAIEAEYKRFWDIERPFTLDEYAHVIVDLKQKIHGNFSLVSKDPDAVVVRTTSCPFDEFVRQSPSLCFMTSSVFGGIAARNFGYAKVVLHKRIALGDDGCYVTVHLRPTEQALAEVGREYFPDLDRASPDIVEQLRLMDSVRHLRQQLVASGSRWEEVVRAAAEAICVVTPDGTIGYANARWRDLLGVEADELIGGRFERLLHPDDLPLIWPSFERVFNGTRHTGHDLRLLHRDGTWREVVASAGPIRDDTGQIVGGLLILRDVSEERQARRLKDEFLSTASHELRTPVAAIKSITQLLQRTLDRQDQIDPEQLGRRLESIQREADRLAVLSGDLLDVARLQNGRLELRPVRLDLRAEVEMSVERQRALLGDHCRHTIVVEQPDEPVLVEAEQARLQQVFGNLLENAVKYSPGGGEIRVVIRQSGERAEVSVADPGIGLEADDLPRLFTPFFRGSNASSDRFPGLGLGLHLCRMLVEAHGGSLSASGAPDQGATFTVSLPAAGLGGEGAVPRRVLVVEDDVGLQEALVGNLELEGFQVTAACDGLEALRRVEADRPDVILLDLMLPRMNGFDFADALQRRGLRPGVPIVVLTADGRAQNKAQQLGAEGWLQKPFDIVRLLDEIQRVLDTSGLAC